MPTPSPYLKFPEIRSIGAILFQVAFSVNLLFGQKADKTTAASFGITNCWLKESFELTKNCVGFSPPVAARAFAYLNTGFYECGVEVRTGYVSLSGQLNGFERRIQPTENIYWPHAFNYLGYSLANYLYANLPPANSSRLSYLKDSLQGTYSKKIPESSLKNAERYADSLLNDLQRWALTDGGHEAYKRNFPKDYQAPECPACWTVTVPGYLTALQPYWGKNRLFVNSNDVVSGQMECPQFSTDSSSDFYADAKEIFTLYQNPAPEVEIIAEYWDDAPGYSGTPTGHLLSFAMQQTQERKLKFEEALHLYALLSISIQDAFILCWKAKYIFNLIRPITYIQRHISPDFHTFIPTPPFPEFPSGHSMQSGAGGEVLKYFFSDTASVTDRSNLYRRDIRGEARSFENISAMVNEISISRLYAGIHFRATLNRSLEYGKFIGQNSIQSLKFRQ